MDQLARRTSIFLITVLALMVQLSAFGQSHTSKTSIYFDVDKFEIRNESKQVIAALLDSLAQATITEITVSGHTDNVAGTVYNRNLSSKRAEAVTRYLMIRGIPAEKIRTTFFGEEQPVATNGDQAGRQQNRRVDISIIYELKPRDTSVDSPAEIAVRDTCTGRDTLLQLPGGTQLVFNRCEYLELKECLEIKELNTTDVILESGISLMDTVTVPIASCGMINLTLRKDCTSKICFTQPVKVLFPVAATCDLCRNSARVWRMNPTGNWDEIKGQQSEITVVTKQGQSFYQMELACANGLNNCDCKQFGTKVKFKTKRSYRLVNVTVTNDCPVMVISSYPSKRKNVHWAEIPCLAGNKTVIATVITKNGDSLVLKEMPLNNLVKRSVFSKCPKLKKNSNEQKPAVFRRATRNVYRKYILKTTDFTPKK